MVCGDDSSGRFPAGPGPGHNRAVEKWHLCRKLSMEGVRHAAVSGRTGCDMKVLGKRRARGDAGFTLIDMLFVVSLIGLLASLAIPGLMRARGAAQASSALGTIRVINSGELSFAISCGLGFYSADLPTLGIPPPGASESFLSEELTTGPTVLKSGYTLRLAGPP